MLGVWTQLTLRWMLRVWLLVIGGTVFALGAGRMLPQGSQIAYLTQLNDLERARWDFMQNRKVLVGYNALILLEVDRHLHQRIGSPLYESMLSDGVSHGLKWSPDGAALAFIATSANSGTHSAVYTLSLNGELRQLTTPGAIGAHFDWTADHRLTYSRWSLDTSWDSWTLAPNQDAVAESLPVVNSAMSDYGATWSPNGQHVVFIQHQNSINVGDLHLKHGESTESIALTSAPLVVFNPLHWSPDSTQVVFSAYVEDFDRQRLNLYVVDITAPNPQPRELTLYTQNNINPIWSPDGTRIAFISDRNNYQAVYTLDIATRQAQRLTDNNFSTVTAPMWSTDGRRLLFSAAVESGHADVYMIDADGQHLRRLTEGGYDDLTPAWRP